MKEFTEKHQAFIAAEFYMLLTERFGARGEAAFIMAVQRYGEQRGSRMAQRALRDGKPLDFRTYRGYGEWVNTESAKEGGYTNLAETVSSHPDVEDRITRCPWAMQFKEMGAVRAGVVYCEHIDKSLVRGFNPSLVFEVKQTLHEHDCCIQIGRGAELADGEKITKHAEYLRPFDYHCGHLYKTFSDISAAVLRAGGAEIAADVLKKFGEKYGAEMADRLTEFKNTDFDLI